MPTTADNQIKSYLNQVKRNLGHLSDREKQALLSDLESHINEALKQRVPSGAPTDADISAVIAEMDSPESFKQASDDLDTKPDTSGKLGKLALATSIAGVVVALLLPFGMIPLIWPLAQVVAFFMGVFTWRSRYSKIAVVTSVVLLMAFIVLTVFTTPMKVDQSRITTKISR